MLQIKKLSRVFLCFFILLTQGCSLYTIRASEKNLLKEMDASGFKQSDLPGKLFTLRSFSKILHPEKPVHLYIEGDGRAFLSRQRISKDPTPRSLLVQTLCLRDPEENIIYLARPCQFTGKTANPGWDEAYWTTRRFAPEVLKEMNHAISVLKKRYQLHEIHLYGYSGGAAIAILVAAERTDVTTLVTIAGNLNHNAVNILHGVTLMPESLNPIDAASRVSQIRQIHFVGEKDKIIPRAIAEEFVQHLEPAAHARILSVPNATHSTGWESQWPSLLQEI